MSARVPQSFSSSFDPAAIGSSVPRPPSSRTQRWDAIASAIRP
jgi:hypothetical protein